MRLLVALMTLTLAVPGYAGDLWLTWEGREATVRLPANWLAADDAAVQIRTGEGTLDLAPVARRLRAGPVGRSERIEGTGSDGPFVLTLSHVEPPEPTRWARTLELGLHGPLGRGLTLDLALDGGEADQAGRLASEQVRGALRDLEVELRGDELLGQLRRSGPVVLVDATGQDGNRLRVRTR